MRFSKVGLHTESIEKNFFNQNRNNSDVKFLAVIVRITKEASKKNDAKQIVSQSLIEQISWIVSLPSFDSPQLDENRND